MLCCVQPWDQTQTDKQTLKERRKGRKTKGGRKAGACQMGSNRKTMASCLLRLWRKHPPTQACAGMCSHNQVQGSARACPSQKHHLVIPKPWPGQAISSPNLHSCPLCPKPPEPRHWTIQSSSSSATLTSTIGTMHRFRPRDPESTTRVICGSREHLTTVRNFSCHGGAGCGCLWYLLTKGQSGCLISHNEELRNYLVPRSVVSLLENC